MAARYDRDWYIGQVTDVDPDEEEVEVSFMKKITMKGNLQFKWPERPDQLWVAKTDMLCQIQKPIPIGKSSRTNKSFQIIDSDLASVTFLFEE